MRNDLQPYLTVRVDPAEMVRYVHSLMPLPPSDPESEPSVALARALNRAFGDARVSSWPTAQRHDQIHVPAALIAAAGVARLTVAADEVVFDIPTLLDVTLQLCEPAGHA